MPKDVPPLALSLLVAAEWFDRELRRRLAADGWPRLSTNQSRLVAELDGVRGQADLARRLEITRQSVHVIVRRLGELGVVEVAGADAPRPGAVVLTGAGRRLGADAARHLADLEAEMDATWAGGPVPALRAALAGFVAEVEARREGAGIPAAGQQGRRSTRSPSRR